MLAVKRGFKNKKGLTCCICLSALKNCKKPPKSSGILEVFLNEDGIVRKRKENSKYPELSDSPEKKEKAKNDLKALLQSIRCEAAQNKEDGESKIKLTDLLKAQVQKKEAKARKKMNLGEVTAKAALNVAEEIGVDMKKVKKELLDHLRKIEYSKEPQVEKAAYTYEQFNVDQQNSWLTASGIPSSERLGIFMEINEMAPESEVKLKIWDRLQQEELMYLALKPPRNQFEEWAQWTEQGRLWRFPIDNDQGMEAEAAVDFTQHVFLEEHLEPWCPKKGPLKKFMDLVLVGLSKNPYLTVEDKIEHIFWYRDYFEKKKQLLQELGAFGSKEIGDSVNTPEK